VQGNLKSRWLRQVLQRLYAYYNSILHEYLTRVTFLGLGVDDGMVKSNVRSRFCKICVEVPTLWVFQKLQRTVGFDDRATKT